jgi:hypothetical protein
MKALFLFLLLFCLTVKAQITGVVANQDSQVETPTETPPTSSADTIVLGELKAFPGAFGYGAYIQGGRGGTIYPVTSTSNGTSPGTFRHAYESSGARIILILVDGTITYNTNIQNIPSNYTIIGQTAPGDGLQATGAMITSSGSGVITDDFIVRHMTFRYGPNGTLGDDDVFRCIELDIGAYFDHVSMSYGWDEILSLTSKDALTRGDGSERVTVANSLFGQAASGHNTGHIFGNSSDTPFDEFDRVGNFTYARNITHLISHRFPNFAGYEGILEDYNNIFSSWGSRLSRVNGSAKIDWYNNRAIANNKGIDPNATNKWAFANRTYEDAITIYTTGNNIETINTNTGQNPQKNLWQYFLDEGPYTEDDVLDDQFFVLNRQGNAQYPPGGLLTAAQLMDSITVDAGHTRSAGSSGLGQDVRDSLDETWIDQVVNETGPSDNPSTTTWSNPTKNSAALWVDADGDYIADNFEDAVGLDKNTSGDATVKPQFVTLHGRTFDNREYTGGSYDALGNYSNGTLTGNNLYTWQEIYWSFLANDFLKLHNAIPTP